MRRIVCVPLQFISNTFIIQDNPLFVNVYSEISAFITIKPVPFITFLDKECIFPAKLRNFTGLRLSCNLSIARPGQIIHAQVFFNFMIPARSYFAVFVETTKEL